ncbi:urate hydroxylase PuuD [Pontivivens nitratireducens]|uniref:urate hydroxylase PuuD n=1 Tax=Pontivivens nitratireducens TaxID=2758038 RepID=UPI00163B42F3|nr:urate hydroxylase PuuD [Pontibrevibacter nitratireducens]
MYEFAIMWDWLALSVRWLHVVTAIAWIGSSFYFIALDLGLNRDIDGPADGEEWQVHGGGFYHIQKYLVAPSAMPEHLTWFKWESYATWLSGVAMLAVVYWTGSELYLIDPAKADLATWQAILLSAGSLAVGWVVYDFLCKSKLGERPTTLMLLLFGLLVVMAWGYDQVFTGRAALLHLGAFTATIMTANVFAIIMPNQRIVVADLKAGRKPDPKYGKIAKLRSTHNNYLTLPVIFLMLSNHYPLAFGTKYNWIIAGLVFLTGVTIRHWFNSQHARSGKPTWTWPVTVILVLIMAWLSTEPDFVAEANAAIPARTQGFMQHEQFEAVANTVRGRCSMCHAAEPFYDGIRWAPKGVMLETDAQIATRAREIYLQSGVTHAMPPANVSYMEQTERDMIAQWFEDAR